MNNNRRRSAGAQPVLEKLETRQLLSATGVSAALLAGPLTIGSTWNYDDGSSISITSPDTYNALDVTSTTGFGALEQIQSTTYEALNPGRGLVAYGGFDSIPLTPATPFSYRPPALIFPKAMVPGKLYRSNFYNGYSSTLAPGGTAAFKLVSSTPQPITVPAGTFSCYEIQAGDELTEYLSPSAGLIEQISSLGGPPSTMKLVSYIIAGDPARAQIAPRIASTTLPDLVVAGTHFRGVAHLTLTNLSSVAETGKTLTQIDVSGTNNINISIGSLARVLSIGAGRSVRLNIPISWDTTGLNDTYFVSATTTDAAGNAITSFLSNGGTIVSPASVTLDVSTITSKKAPGGAVCIVTVTNDGTVRAREKGDIELLISNTYDPQHPLANTTAVLSAPVAFSIAAGASHSYPIHVNAAQLKAINADVWIVAEVISTDAGMAGGILTPLK